MQHADGVWNATGLCESYAAPMGSVIVGSAALQQPSCAWRSLTFTPVAPAPRISSSTQRAVRVRLGNSVEEDAAIRLTCLQCVAPRTRRREQPDLQNMTAMPLE
ncbi:uncharacterized protein LAESUDRAFT_332511 [Laetiporus sulphureus 93-53]|uniref:Uncharacterized protein n=1 Tax=Laetiporus sulphureus 93-53 TaxID=1314785 RepID=A0A165CXY2_9APHY|nr:uncharacterized protein LAESUDRAFT_332511 [Laetiporus sulphureus 93-53]KZT03706.1 hypothetical protein LAESUDRAFT_332511 [Laetiporus sulphureus 93-53]